MSIPTGDQRARRRTGLPHRRLVPDPKTTGGGELRRPHAQHHGRREPAPRRHPQQGGGAAQRHDGLGAGRLPLRPRPHRPLRARHAEDRWRPRCSAPRPLRSSSGVGVIGALDACRAARTIRPHARMCSMCATPAEYRAGHRPGSRMRAGRAAGAGAPTIGSACATRASCWSTIPACAPAWPAPGCARWAHCDVFVVDGGLDAVRTEQDAVAAACPELRRASRPMIDATGLARAAATAATAHGGVDLARSHRLPRRAISPARSGACAPGWRAEAAAGRRRKRSW